MVIRLLRPHKALTLTLTLGFLMTLTQFKSTLGVEAVEETRGTLYRKTGGVRVNQGQEFLICGDGKNCYGRERRSCVVDCRLRSDCSGVNFNPANGSCMGVSSSIYTFGAVGVNDSTWNNYSPVTWDVRDRGSEDWVLAFRAQSTMSRTVAPVVQIPDGMTTNTYWNDSLHSENELLGMDTACYSSDRSRCTDYYRSQLLTNWPSNNIDKVRLVLYTNGSKVVEVVFNGTGSSRDSWMHTDRLISSPWSDLVPGDSNDIRIDGYQSRAFTIVQNSSKACPVGWFYLMDNYMDNCQPNEPAAVLNNYLELPKLLYAPSDLMVDFFDYSTGRTPPYLMADVMAIFVRML